MQKNSFNLKKNEQAIRRYLTATKDK